jgi:zinc protease
MARRPTPSSWRGLEVDLPVAERTLANGLKALALPRRHTPIVVCDLYYPVGSFDEPPGLTGLAHFVEHMLFKGTDRFPKGEIDRLVLVAAGQSNAETGEDSTHYWFTLPSDRWELALAIEADRMCGVRFDPREVEIERQVIGEERARELNTSLGRLEQTHLAVSFLRHPYRNPIVGWPEDLARIDAQALRTFYAAHYRPDGAILVVVGDVEPQAALDLVARHFEGVPVGPAAIKRPVFAEPDQTGRRDFALSEPESGARGLLGWRAVPRCHRDSPALEVLADLLCCGRRSRLWHSLVETAKTAIWVDSGYHAACRAGQFFIQLEAASGVDPAAIERQIADELRSLAEAGPLPDELARASRRLHSAWRWEQEDLASLASGLGTAALWGDWRAWQAEHRAALTVLPQQIRRVVHNYLSDDHLTAGWSIPRARSRLVRPSEKPAGRVLPGRAAARQASPLSSKLPADAYAAPTDAAALEQPDLPAPVLTSLIVPTGVPRLIDYRPRRTVLDNGLRLVFDRRPGTGVVAVELFADAGLLREAKPGLASLTGRLLEEGTTTRTAQEISQEIEDVGGSLEVGSTGGSLRVCCEDLARGLTLLADVVLRPALPAEALGWISRRMAAELRADLEDPAFRTELSFRGLVYGLHPLSRDPRGGVAELKRLTRVDVQAHHRRHFTPQNAILVAVGDFDPRRLVSQVKRCFGQWVPHARSLPPPSPISMAPRPRVRRIRHAGEQVHIMLGHLGIARNHPDYDALAVLDCIFGSGPGFCDRLGRIVRDELGLAYSISGGMTDSADVVPGLFRVYAGTMPEEADRVVATITEQIRAMHAGAFSDLEVDRARRYLAGAWAFEFQTVEQRAERLLELERWGLDLDEPRRWPERIAATTPGQVRDAARRHLVPGALCRVELGPSRPRSQPGH